MVQSRVNVQQCIFHTRLYLDTVGHTCCIAMLHTVNRMLSRVAWHDWKCSLFLYMCVRSVEVYLQKFQFVRMKGGNCKACGVMWCVGGMAALA